METLKTRRGVCCLQNRVAKSEGVCTRRRNAGVRRGLAACKVVAGNLAIFTLGLTDEPIQVTKLLGI
jgi:hypothetical protein